MIQEDFNSANRSIKENSYYMKRSVETDNAKDCLRYANNMLVQLKNDNLSPKDYYMLFQKVFDELSWLQNNFLTQKKKKSNMYEVVQYANSIIPRLYLMVTVGAFQMGNSETPIIECMKDMLAMIKGVQHPCRGLFLRYYFLKIVKDKVEDNEQDLDLEELTSIYLENLRQMNNLWIRMNSLIEDKETRTKQRKDLAICVGENLLRLANLESIDIAFYQEKLFPQIVNIILENKDRISQEYLFNILVSAFPDDYHFATLQQLLEATEKLSSRVNLNALYLQLMERFTTFAKNNKDNRTDMTFVYEHFTATIQNILDSQKKYKIADVFCLIAGFMDFTVFFYDGNLEYVNNIIHLGIQLTQKTTKEEITNNNTILESMVKVLSVPFEKLALHVLKLENFPVLLNMLPFTQKSQVALRICQSVCKTNTYLVNELITKKFLLFVEPLFSLQEQSEEGVRALSRVFHLVDSHSPQVLSEMLSLLEIHLSTENHLHLKILYPVLLNKYVHLLSKLNRIKNYLMDMGEDQTLDQAEFKALFSKDHLASYLSDEERSNLVFSIETDMNLDAQTLLSNCFRICQAIETDSPRIAMNLYFDLMLVIDQSICQGISPITAPLITRSREQ